MCIDSNSICSGLDVLQMHFRVVCNGLWSRPLKMDFYTKLMLYILVLCPP